MQNLNGKELKRIYGLHPCADPEKIIRGPPTLTNDFLIDEGKEDPNATINGPSLARQQNAI